MKSDCHCQLRLCTSCYSVINEDASGRTGVEGRSWALASRGQEPGVQTPQLAQALPPSLLELS